ncbi:STELLO glycosyltransferase family protein [Caenimonas aquaedulcis]|uniref:DUF288 domain-containing protein n=1 Tax=Caenimonas aquaedulcis TaxID=2793270 RepID=A0A931H619_9BURK|nr:STELLO glycosyltransferase family protein [Caenimonas aquaedulcis]MBG9389070.1 DUF288 domain-containing protein [Caenimonas aquaedulcis]
MGFTVITTIQGPCPSVQDMVGRGLAHGHGTIVVGDRKTPRADWPQGVEFLGIDAQRQMAFGIAAQLPENHYARKNLGYLQAMARKADFVFDTDDDNAPLATWAPRQAALQARHCAQAGWVNAYRWFTGAHVWPRGLPLDHAGANLPVPPLAPARAVTAPIQQGLANGSPDVDAVWRLVMDREITFDDAPSVSLAPGTWCPFNSQSTWWFPQAFPLMYLPSFVSFRMTDIWRSFVAQRCLWALGHELVFHGPEMFQDRNPHNLMRDFEQEVPGYLGNERFRQVLEALELPPGPEQTGGNLLRCYEALVKADLVPQRELPLVESWIADVAAATGAGP